MRFTAFPYFATTTGLTNDRVLAKPVVHCGGQTKKGTGWLGFCIV